MHKKSVILIDGSNFYFKLKDLNLNKLLDFDYSTFTKDLAQQSKLISTTYYIGRIKQDGTKKTDKLLANQQRMLATLKKHKVRYKLGYLMKTDTGFHEKGVDVQIAVDILVTAYEKIADQIILISSDTDLEPAIKKAISKGITVEYIGFKHKPSIAMKRFCNKYKLLNKENLEKYIS